MNAATAEKLFMKIEEFLMPTSVQLLGNFKIVFMDYIKGAYRELDIIEFDQMESRPGEIKKASEVQVGTETTSLADQTYLFHFQVMHRVPIGGFISILLSADGRNGVEITDPTNMDDKCFLLKGGAEEPLDCLAGTTEEDSRPYVNISCTPAFGPNGIASEQTIKL